MAYGLAILSHTVDTISKRNYQDMHEGGSRVSLCSQALLLLSTQLAPAACNGLLGHTMAEPLASYVENQSPPFFR